VDFAASPFVHFISSVCAGAMLVTIGTCCSASLKVADEQTVCIRIEVLGLDPSSVKVHPDGTGALKRGSSVHRQEPGRIKHQDSYARLAVEDKAPLHFLAGTDAVGVIQIANRTRWPRDGLLAGTFEFDRLPRIGRGRRVTWDAEVGPEAMAAIISPQPPTSMPLSIRGARP